MPEAVLVVDCGTSKVHTNIVSLDGGELLKTAEEEYSWEISADASEKLNPELIWEAAQTALEKLFHSDEDKVKDIIAIGFSFFGDNVIPVDRDGEALYPFCRPSLKILSDPRVKDELQRGLPDQMFSEYTGNANTLFFSTAVLQYLRVFHPDIVARADKYYTVQQFMLRKLNLPDYNDFTCAGRRTMVDCRNHDWAKGILSFFGIRKDQLGEIHPSATIAGEIERFGRVSFGKKIPVSIGGHDAASATLGQGVMPDGTCNIIGNSAGSYDLNGFFSNTFVNAWPKAKELMTGCGLTEKDYYLQLGSFARQNVYWFLRVFLGEKSGNALTSLFAKSLFSGERGVVWESLPTDGEVSIEGMTAVTTPEEIFEGLIEEITFPMRWNFENEFSTVRGRPFEKMRIASGGAKSDAWVQLKADILSLPVERVDNIEASSVGAAMNAAISIGKYRNYEEAIQAFVKVEKVFLPNSRRAELYNERYREYCERRKKKEMKE